MKLIEFDKQTGRKFSTKGNLKDFIDIENILYIQCQGILSTITMSCGKKVEETKV